MKLFLFLSVFFFSCSMPIAHTDKNGDQKIVTIVSWNLQTFFDSQTIGSEYDEFKGPKSHWNEQLYINRIETVCALIKESQADVYVFQEVENSGVIQDISNALASQQKQYSYSCFSKQEEEALGIAILSHYPLNDVTVHQIDYKTALGLSEFESSKDIFDGMVLEQPSMRAILSSLVTIDDNTNFSLYACHWKSKYGGAEKSEVWRNAQEQLLATLLAKETNTFLITGDFNRTLEEFVQNKENEIVLRGFTEPITVLSSWVEYSSKMHTQGSYFYQGKWEKIDHFFYDSALEVVDFQIIVNDITTTEEGLPDRFDVYNGKGSSDHLPIKCVVEF